MSIPKSDKDPKKEDDEERELTPEEEIEAVKKLLNGNA